MEKRGSLMRLTSAAARLGVKPATLRDWFLKRKNLDFVKVGSSGMYRRRLYRPVYRSQYHPCEEVRRR